MDEGGGVLADAVVGTAPRREVQLAGLAEHSFLGEDRQQRSDRIGRQGPPEELGLEHQVLVLQWRWLLVVLGSICGAWSRPKSPRLLGGHVPAKVCRRVGAGSGDELLEQLCDVLFGA